MTRAIGAAAISVLLGIWRTPAAQAAAEGGVEHQPNWLTWLRLVHIGGRAIFGSDAAVAFAWSLVAIVLLAAICAFGSRRPSIRPGRYQMLLEMLVDAMRKMTEMAMGPRGAQFTPFIGGLFIYIAFMNLLGLVPGFMSPTSNLSITAGLALAVFMTVHYYGFRENGAGYVKHFVSGVPLQFPYVLIAPLVFAVHLVGEIVRPVTLALRLFGNLMAGHFVLVVLVGLVVGLARDWIPLPVQLPNVLLEVLVGIVQAMIFAMLAAVYLDGVLHETEGGAG